MFQYPLSGRRLCSSPHVRPFVFAERVSVPSIGSKAVQRLPPGCTSLSPGGFSTLYRVEGCAAAIASAIEVMSFTFQYPLSGRRLCSIPAVGNTATLYVGFSTLYRVEGCAAAAHVRRWLHARRSVSYTHLDVYKRQSLSSCRAMTACWKPWPGICG